MATVKKHCLHTVSCGFASSLALSKSQKDRTRGIVNNLSLAVSKVNRRGSLIVAAHFTRLLSSAELLPLSTPTLKQQTTKNVENKKKCEGGSHTPTKKWVAESLQWKEDTFWRQILLLEGNEPSHCDEEVKKTWKIISKDFTNDPVVRASFDGQCITYAAQALKTAFFNNLWVPFYARVRRLYRIVVPADRRCPTKESTIRVSIAVQKGLQGKEWSPEVARFVIEVRSWLGIAPDDPVEVTESWLKGQLSSVMRANYEMQKRFHGAGVRQMRLTPVFRVKRGHVRLDANTIADILLHIGATKKKTWKHGETAKRRREEKRRRKAKAAKKKHAKKKRKLKTCFRDDGGDTFLSTDDYERRRACLSSFFKIPREGKASCGERRRFFWTLTMTTDGVTAHFQCVRSGDWEAFVASQTRKTASKMDGKKKKKKNADDECVDGEAGRADKEGDEEVEEEKPKRPPKVKVSACGDAEKRILYPANVVTIAIDPGRVNIVYVVVRGKGQDGKDTESTYCLTAGRYYETSGIRRGMRRIAKWQAHLKLPDVFNPVFKREEEVTTTPKRQKKQRRKRNTKQSKKAPPRTFGETRGLRTTSLDDVSSYIKAFNTVSSAWWLEASKRRYGRLRFQAMMGKRKVVDAFCAHLKEQVLRHHGHNARIVVVYGGATFSPSGKGNLTVPTTAIFKAFKRAFDDVQVQDEFRTTLCCPECHTAQHKVWKIEGDPDVHHGPRFVPSKEGSPVKTQIRGSLFCPKCSDLRCGAACAAPAGAS
jgi:hypothetical protein